MRSLEGIGGLVKNPASEEYAVGPTSFTASRRENFAATLGNRPAAPGVFPDAPSEAAKLGDLRD
jgi:hypothetical protein